MPKNCETLASASAGAEFRGPCLRRPLTDSRRYQGVERWDGDAPGVSLFFYAGRNGSRARTPADDEVAQARAREVSPSPIPSASAHYGERGTGYRFDADSRKRRTQRGVQGRGRVTVAAAPLRMGEGT